MARPRLNLIEFDYHPEVLRNTCRILEDTPWDVAVFTDPAIWKQAGAYPDALPGNLSVHLRTGSLGDFLASQESALRGAEVTLFNTAASHYRRYTQTPWGGVKIVRVHNANSFFLPLHRAYRPKGEPFYWWKDLSYFLRHTLFRNEQSSRRRFLEHVDYYAFPAPTLRDHAVGHLAVPADRALTLPFGYFPGNERAGGEGGSDRVTFSVLGGLDRRKRDYDLLVEACTRLVRDGDAPPVRLVLLGSAASATGRSVVRRLRALEGPAFELVHFPGFVEQAAFQEWIDRTDFLVLPARIETRFTIYGETYGTSKLSGGINDIIAYGKPALVDARYPVEGGLAPLVEGFAGAKDLAKKLRVWCQTRSFLDIDVARTLEPYRLENIRGEYLRTLDRLVDGR